MNYEQDRDTASGADDVPALLFVNSMIGVRCDIWIFEDSCGRLKRNATLPAVRAILPVVPHENHMYIQKCITLRRFPEHRFSSATLRIGCCKGFFSPLAWRRELSESAADFCRLWYIYGSSQKLEVRRVQHE